MPRTKHNPNAVLELELRITPPDESQITEWYLDDDFIKFVAYEEGGVGTEKKLHYHCYIEYKRSRTLLTKWIYKVARCKEHDTGNSVFFSRKPHDHTYGYISKENNLVIRHGIDQSLITEWFNQSQEYKRTKERDRKRKHRTRKEVIDNILQHAKVGLHENMIGRNVEAVVKYMIGAFNDVGLILPTRSSMDGYVITLLAPHDNYLVKSYYLKSFSYT